MHNGLEIWPRMCPPLFHPPKGNPPMDDVVYTELEARAAGRFAGNPHRCPAR